MRLIPILLFVCLLFTCYWSTPAPALGPEDDNNLTNYAYLTDFGIGTYDTDDREVRAFQVPFAYQLRPIQDDIWGVKLLFPVTFGSLGIDVIDIGGIEVPLDSKVLGVNPGVELQIPIRRDWVIKPFGNVGLARDVSQGEGALIYSAGIKSSLLIPWKKFQFALGAGLFYDAYKPKDEEQNDFASVGIGWDMVYPLGFTLSGRKANIGGYLAYYYYFDALEFDRIIRNPIEIDQTMEIGMTFGTYSPIPIWIFNFKRIGLAYRFGEDFKAIRLVFGFPF